MCIRDSSNSSTNAATTGDSPTTTGTTTTAESGSPTVKASKDFTVSSLKTKFVFNDWHSQ